MGAISTSTLLADIADRALWSWSSAKRPCVYIVNGPTTLPDSMVVVFYFLASSFAIESFRERRTWENKHVVLLFYNHRRLSLCCCVCLFSPSSRLSSSPPSPRDIYIQRSSSSLIVRSTTFDQFPDSIQEFLCCVWSHSSQRRPTLFQSETKTLFILPVVHSRCWLLVCFFRVDELQSSTFSQCKVVTL